MSRPPTEEESSEILRTAQPYLDLPIEELVRALDDEIDEADSRGLPHRGINDKQFWQRYAAQLKRELLQQKMAASATAGVAASHAVAWAHEMGLDLNDYRIPIAIVVALAVKSLWDQMDTDPNDKGKGDTVGNDSQY